MKSSIRFALSAAVASTVAIRLQAFETVDIGLAVVDDSGKPVANATVGMGVSDSHGQKAAGVTDSNGMFSARLKMMGSLYVRAEMDGYYKTSGYPWDGPTRSRMVPPVNVFTVVLKRIKSPVAMLKRDLSLELPALGLPCGLDLAVGDWVAPQGKGMVADMYVQGIKQLQDYRNWEFRCLWQFTNGNGVVKHQYPGRQSLAVQSRLIPPPVAPSDGYTTVYEFLKSYHAGEGTHESAGPDEHLLFRVRTVTNATGEVVSANVGWIESAIDLEGRGTQTLYLYMHYYFNPDPSSRSLEPEEIAKRQVKK